MNELAKAATCRELSVFECGKEECVKNKAIALTKKTYHLFHYVVSGKGTLLLNKKEYHISKKTIFFIPRETDAIYFPDKDDPWNYIWVGFDGTKGDGYLEELGIDINHPLFMDENNALRKYFDQIVKRFHVSGEHDIHMVGSLYQLFGDMFFLNSGSITVSSSRVAIDLAITFINNNYQFDIGIKDIARNANVTPNYLSTIFQKSEHMSTKTYLTKVRMKKAMELLNSGHFKIKEVAEMTGYKNQLHFSSQFKKYYGKSPLHYLKEGI